MESSMRLDVRDTFPEHLLSLPAANIRSALSGPTLFHLSGASKNTLFVSVLLHGNEDVGWRAIQSVLKLYQNRRLPWNLSLFVGNVEAAEVGVRFLATQPDFNRVWPGSEIPETPYHLLMRSVVAEMVDRGVTASIDLHNNSGRNPYYSCICSLNSEHLQLAAMFSPIVMYFQRPKGVQTQAFAQFCPSITCECGPIGDLQGASAAARLIERVMELDHLSNAVVADRSVRLYHTVAVFRVRPGVSIGFADNLGLTASSADVVFRGDLDRLNFQRLQPGEILGQVNSNSLEFLEVKDESGRDVTPESLTIEEGLIKLKRACTPSMLTCDPKAIQQDCVGYFMERYPLTMQHAFIDDSDVEGSRCLP